MNDKIRRLQEQIKEEYKKISNCNHVYGISFYDPETQREPYPTGAYMGDGVDRWPEIGFRDKEVPRWTRVCAKCGHRNSTYKQKPIITGSEPDFD